MFKMLAKRALEILRSLFLGWFPRYFLYPKDSCWYLTVSYPDIQFSFICLSSLQTFNQNLCQRVYNVQQRIALSELFPNCTVACMADRQVRTMLCTALAVS